MPLPCGLQAELDITLSLSLPRLRLIHDPTASAAPSPLGPEGERVVSGLRAQNFAVVDAYVPPATTAAIRESVVGMHSGGLLREGRTGGGRAGKQVCHTRWCSPTSSPSPTAVVQRDFVYHFQLFGRQLPANRRLLTADRWRLSLSTDRGCRFMCFPSAGDKLQMNVSPDNLGLCCASCLVAFPVALSASVGSSVKVRDFLYCGNNTSTSTGTPPPFLPSSPVPSCVSSARALVIVHGHQRRRRSKASAATSSAGSTIWSSIPLLRRTSRSWTSSSGPCAMPCRSFEVSTLNGAMSWSLGHCLWFGMAWARGAVVPCRAGP